VSVKSGEDQFHWFNPLVWIVVRQFAANREVLCDRGVLKALGDIPTGKVAYGQTLIKMVSLLATPVLGVPGLTPLLSTKKEIKNRITLLSYPDKARWKSRILGMAMLGLLTAAGFTIAAPSSPHDENPRQNQDSAPASDIDNEDCFVSEEFTDDDPQGSTIAEKQIYQDESHDERHKIESVEEGHHDRSESIEHH
jgi:hypothetical protein